MEDGAGRARPYRVPAPHSDALIQWPTHFGTRFTVVVDVEEEFDWAAPFDRRARAVTAMAALPEAHRRFAAAGVGLACMADHPAVTDPRGGAILAEIAADTRSCVGAQLHAWVTPPHDEVPGIANSFQGNLPPALEAAKIDRLTEAVEAATARRPTAFRAGRYGIGAHSRSLLAARGYRLDLSVRARHDYSGQGGPDFRQVGNAAYRVDGLVEVPATTIFTGALARWGAALHHRAAAVPRGPGLLARAGLVSRVPLTPEGVPAAEALAAIDAGVAQGERLLVFSFHSPSLVPGHTPYVRDARDLACFWRWWDAVLDRLAARGVRHATLGGVLDAT